MPAATLETSQLEATSAGSDLGWQTWVGTQHELLQAGVGGVHPLAEHSGTRCMPDPVSWQAGSGLKAIFCPPVLQEKACSYGKVNEAMALGIKEFSRQNHSG